MTAPAFAKRASKRDAVLDLLSDGKWHSARELTEVGGWRYSARLHEAKKQGYVIERGTLDHQFFYFRMAGGGVAMKCSTCQHEKAKHDWFCDDLTRCFWNRIEKDGVVTSCACRAFTTDPMPKQEELGL